MEVDPDDLARLNDVKLAPGMPAEVMILTGKRIVVDHMLRPCSNRYSGRKTNSANRHPGCFPWLCKGRSDIACTSWAACTECDANKNERAIGFRIAQPVTMGAYRLMENLSGRAVSAFAKPTDGVLVRTCV